MTDTERHWLDVPFAEKDQAKGLGARWDPQARRWYATRVTMSQLERWAALPDVPATLPGEDRSFGGGLFVDLVPASCWFTNVRSCVDQRDWERLRRMVVERAGRRCEACSRGRAPAEGRGLEVHERWLYQETTAVQVLRRLICLCTDCHTATHMGLAGLRGIADKAEAHLAAVNHWSPDQVEEHVGAAFELFTQRSRTHWQLDLRILDAAGVRITRPPAPRQRLTIAGETVWATRDREAHKPWPGE
jgi:Domain of unknown function (DUF5710)